MKKFTEPNKISNYLDHGVDVDNLEVHLFDEINYDVAREFIKKIHLLVSQSRDKTSYKPLASSHGSSSYEVQAIVLVYS